MDPICNNWLTYRETADGLYCVNNHAVNMSTLLDEQEFSFLNLLDGKTDPYQIRTGYSPEEIDELLEMFYDLEYIRNGRMLQKSLGNLSFLIRELYMEDIRKKGYLLADGLMRILWFPFLAFGIWFFAGHWNMIESSRSTLTIVLSSLLGVITGTVLHELAHIIAGISFGADVYGLGCGVTSFMPYAFVIMNTEKIRSRRKKIHIDMAGIEMNLFLTGLYLLLSCAIPNSGPVFFFAAIPNALLALSNLIPWNGSDGLHTLSGIIGCADFYEYAVNILTNQKKRRKLLACGINGWITMVCCLVIILLQVTTPAFLVLNIALFVI